MRLILLLLILLPFLGFSQEATITGRVLNKKKQPVEHANIYLSGTYDGALTDKDGYFSFKTDQRGVQKISSSHPSYQPFEKQIEVQDSVYIAIQLEVIAEQIEAIEIRAGQMQVGNKYNAVLTALDVVTTAGTNGNIIAALQKLPGAQIAGEDGRLMVRGGDPTETQTYINGIQVFQPYTPAANNLPVRGRFSPFLFKGTNFSTGGYAAEYGNALSGILNLTTANELADPKTDLSFSSVGLGVSNTQRWENNSVSINLSYSNLKPYNSLMPQEITWIRPFQQGSGEAIWRHQGKRSFLNLYANYSFEDFKLQQDEINIGPSVTTDIQSRSSYFNSTYHQELGNNWKLELGAGLGYNKRNLHFSQYFIPNDQVGSHIKTLFRKTMGLRWQWVIGAEHQYQKFDEQYGLAGESAVSYGYERNHFAVFSEGQYQILRGLSLGAGLRYIRALKSQQLLEPRASIGYVINSQHQVSFAYGQYHQEAPEPIAKFNDQLGWAAAEHLIFNYSWIQRGRMLRMEAYHKDYQKLFQYDSPIPGYQSHYDNAGYGRVQGLDFFWKDSKTIPNLQYWISYSLTDARKKEGYYPISVQPSYVAKHQVSLVAKYWISALKSQASLTNTYSSGRPYHNPNTTGFMQYQTKGQNQVDVSWSYLISQQKILHLSFTNILGNEPVYGYQYRTVADANGQFQSRAIRPNAKHFIFVGFFWTISKDRKDNQLDQL